MTKTYPTRGHVIKAELLGVIPARGFNLSAIADALVATDEAGRYYLNVVDLDAWLKANLDTYKPASSWEPVDLRAYNDISEASAYDDHNLVVGGADDDA